jgi:TonB-linked SusC/RagA family outer membrane protein
MRYRINEWLTFRETISFQYAGTKRNEFLPYNAIGTDWLNGNVNKAVEANTINAAFKTETQLAFNAPFSNRNHEMSGTLNWITNQSTWESILITGSKSASSLIQDPAVGSHINWMQTQSSEGREIGTLGNLNYKFKDRYIIQSILRADASSVFGDNNKWGLFKGIAVAWRFSEESFLDRATWLNESKLRASYGVSGRQPNDAYARFATYETSNNGSYIFNPAVIPAQIQLSNLKWESLTSYDIGLEVNMFKNRVFVELDYYEKITENILFNNYKIPYSSGYDQLKFLNGGELRNYGIEIMFDYKIIQNQNLRWSIYGNTSKNINSFTKLPDNFNTEQGTSIGNGEFPKRVIEGEPIGSFFGFRYLGVWSSDEDVVARDLEGNIILDGDGNPVPLTYAGIYTFQGGDAKYEDINGDGRIDLNDVVYIGNSNPDYIGGFGTSLRYRSFDFSMAFNYRYGFDIVNRVAINTQSMNNRNNQSKAVLHRWRVDGQNEAGMLPRAYMGNPANNLGSDRYVEKGDFTRLNMVSLAYRLNNETCQRLGINSASVNINARKLLTFTNYTGQDPEIGQDASNPFWIGEDRANTPPPRVITISFSIGF